MCYLYCSSEFKKCYLFLHHINYPDSDKKIDIAFDSRLDVHGWKFSLFIRSDKSGEDVKLEDYVKKIDGEQKGKYDHSNRPDRRYYLDETFKFDESPENITEFIASIVNKL